MRALGEDAPEAGLGGAVAGDEAKLRQTLEGAANGAVAHAEGGGQVGRVGTVEVAQKLEQAAVDGGEAEILKRVDRRRNERKGDGSLIGP